MKLLQLLFVMLLSAGVAAAAAVYVSTHQTQGGAAIRETAYQRVMRTNELRCGYAVYAPYFTRDAATGQLGGIWYRMTEDLGAHLGLRIIWAEEVGLGDIATSLQNGRIDMYCGGLWTAGKRIKSVDFLKPSAFEPVFAYVRADDHRFDRTVGLINDPAVRISTIDGEGGGLLAAELFPKATPASLPQIAGYPEMFNQLLGNKADIAISAPSGVAAFLAGNPGRLRALASSPLKIYPCAFAVRYGEQDLRDMLNQAQDDLIANGDFDRFITEGETHPGDFWHPAKAYTAQR